MTAPDGLVWCLGALALGFPFLLVWLARRGGRLALGLGMLSVVPWALGVWAFFIEPETLTVRHVTVESEAWAGAPLRIGLMSDTHVGSPHMSPRRLKRIIARMNAQRPDLVVLLGDYVGGHDPADQRPAAERAEIMAGLDAFRGLKSPLGTYAVLGNHDSWYDEVAVATRLDAAGVEVLQNQSVWVPAPGGVFTLAGVADMHSRRMETSVAEALRGVAKGRSTILMTHWPDVFEQAPRDVALTVAGHSHCGQVAPPLMGRPFSASPGAARWPCGAYLVDGRNLYVTGGLGTSVVPMRIGAPPEIVILTLKRAAD